MRRSRTTEQHDQRRDHQQRRRAQAELLHERRKDERRHRLAERAAGDVERHRHAALLSREPVHERRRRRVERRAAEPAKHEHQRSVTGSGASPISVIVVTHSTGPASSSTRGRQRSAMWPKPSCATEFAS